MLLSQEDHFVVGADIGGSHITAALVETNRFEIKQSTLTRKPVNSGGQATEILECWIEAIEHTLKKHGDTKPDKIAIAMPGPFDYEEGVCLIKGLHKYESLYGLNIKNYISDSLDIKPANICFVNDAQCFLEGEMKGNQYNSYKRTLGITLGTGLGSAISFNGNTEDANFAVSPFKGTIAEEYLSTRWFVERYYQLSGERVKDVKDIILHNHPLFIDSIFEEFADTFFQFLSPLILNDMYEVLIIGGNIVKAADRFLDRLQAQLNTLPVAAPIQIHLANLGEYSAMIGASSYISKIATLNL
jgi:glucokinase